MKRLFAVILLAIIALPVFALGNIDATQQTVIIHFDQLKSRKFDDTAKDITYKPVIGRADQTSYIMLRNDLLTPREIKLSILDLKEPEYDLYIDGKYIHVVKKSELESGIPISLPGALVPAEYRSFYAQVHENAGKLADSLFNNIDKEQIYCKSNLVAVADWTNSIDMGDKTIRTTSIIVVPEGSAISFPGGRMLNQCPPDLMKSTKEVGDAIQLIRRDVNRHINSSGIKNDTLKAITPIDLSVSTKKSIYQPGKTVTVTAKLKNNTDRKISGNIKFDAPKGWKVMAVNPKVDMQPFSKEVTTEFRITVPKKAKAVKSVGVDAELMVEGIPLILHSTVK